MRPISKPSFVQYLFKGRSQSRFHNPNEKKQTGNQKRPPAHRVMRSQWREAHKHEENGENQSKSPVRRALAFLFSGEILVQCISSHFRSINQPS